MKNKNIKEISCHIFFHSFLYKNRFFITIYEIKKRLTALSNIILHVIYKYT